MITLIPRLPEDPAKQKRLLGGLLPLLLVVAYVHLIHGPARERIRTLDGRLDRTAARNEQVRSPAAAARAELERRIGTYEQHVARLESLIPGSEDMAELLRSVSGRAQETGVDLLRIVPHEVAEEEPYDRQDFFIIVAGDYHDIGRFLAAVGSLERIVVVSDLRLDRPPSSNEPAEPPRRPAKLTAEIRLQTYLRSHVPAAAATDLGGPGRPAPPPDAAEQGATFVFDREVFHYPTDPDRDPFMPLTGPAFGPRFEELRLRGIIYSSVADASVALLADADNRIHRLRKGQRVGNARVVEVGERSVRLAVEDFGVIRLERLELRRADETGS